MLTQEQINDVWTVRSDNYYSYVKEELFTNRPENYEIFGSALRPDFDIGVLTPHKRR